MHPQQQLHGATHPHGSTTATEGEQNRTINTDKGFRHQSSNSKPPRGHTEMHPQPRTPRPTAASTAQPPTRAQGSAPSTAISTQPSNTNLPRGCTTVHPRPGLPPLRPLFRHPTAAEGAALCTLNSNCTTQPTCTAAQPPPRAQGSAPSAADSPTLGRSTEPHSTTHSNRSRSVTPLTILRESPQADSVVPAEMRRC